MTPDRVIDICESVGDDLKTLDLLSMIEPDAVRVTFSVATPKGERVGMKLIVHTDKLSTTTEDRVSAAAKRLVRALSMAESHGITADSPEGGP
jgi:hypothetical protein